MDYLFVPGASSFDNHVRDMLALRPNVTAFPPTTILLHIDAFINKVEDTVLDAATKIENLYVGSHANARGQFFIEMDAVTIADNRGFVSYEDLEGVRDRVSIRIGNEAVLPRPEDTEGHSTIPFFYIKGCRIGNARPYLELLKTALGGELLVNAPKYLHAIGDFHGFLEFFKYAFLVFSKTPITERAAMRTAFREKGFTYFDGTAIPDERWDTWIREVADSRRNVNVRFIPAVHANATRRVQRAPLGGDLGRQFINRGETPIVSLSKNYGAQNPPSQITQRLQDLRAAFLTKDEYKNDHPYPFYQRYGYTSFDQFFNGLNWHITSRTHGADKLLVFEGRRFEYELRLPITHIEDGSDSNKLIFNHYPQPFVASRYIQDPLLIESNPQFFQTV